MLKIILTAAILLTLVTACNEVPKKDADTATTTKGTAATETTLAKKPVTNCYRYAKSKETTTATLTITNDTAITGNMHYNPYEKDGAIGEITGTKKGDEIIVVWKYIIEGNKQAEEKLMTLKGDSLLIKTGPLTDVKGVMQIKNKATATVQVVMVKAPCN